MAVRIVLFINSNTRNPQMKHCLCPKHNVQTQLIQFADRKKNNYKSN